MSPASHTMNKYHDKKRKIEYNRITQFLKDEALMKNKKVALNENENEIRLTNNTSETNSQIDSDVCSKDKYNSSFESRKFSHQILPDNILMTSHYNDNSNPKKHKKDKDNKKPGTNKMIIHNTSNQTIQE